jgi:hypothetical protein
MTDAAAEHEIWVFGLEDPRDRSILFRRAEVRYERSKISAAVLRDRIGTFLDGMHEVIERVPGSLGKFRVDSIAIKAEISAKGTVSLVGTGGELGGTGGITIMLTRPDAGS